MRKIIHDFDNTLGIHGCDVDDGLALLYLLGCDEAEIIGVTTTYGNSKLEVVQENTEKMLAEIGRTDIAVHRGGIAAGDYKSDAAVYLAEMAEKYKGELEILATGSLTNIYGAALQNPDFFSQVKQIVLMGGITAPLVFAKQTMDELNFSCDPAAALAVLQGNTVVATMTGNNCLKVLFTRDEYCRRLTDESNPAVRFILEKTGYWFDDNINNYGIQGFYNWDVASAVYLMHPELFAENPTALALSEQDLQRGFLRKADEGQAANCTVYLPEIQDEAGFRNTVYECWLRAKINYK